MYERSDGGHRVLRRIIFTAVFIVAVLVLRWLLLRTIRGDTEFMSETQRRWTANVKMAHLA